MVCIVGKMAQDVGMVCRCGGVIFHLVWLVFEASIPTVPVFLQKTFCDLFLLLLFFCKNDKRRKVRGEAKGKMHGQLFCSHKTKNHHKLKCFQVKV